MDTASGSLTSIIEAVYRESAHDPDFGSLIQAAGFSADHDIADLIDVDGRLRLALGRPIDLDRYLSSIPGLHSHELALDAAIDVTLRHLSKGSRPTHDAIRALREAYPQFAGAIDEAAFLAEAVVSTTGVSSVVRRTPQRQVPSDFGPLIENGQRRYRLVSPLGSGSAGEVYLAQDRRLSDADLPAMVAIKVLSARGRSDAARQQLIDEASKARRVNHNNVVRVLDRGVSDDDEDYIVYEYIDSGTVDKWFEEQGRSIKPQRAAQLVEGIARGLHAAHGAGLLHCDLKPNNILVTIDGTPKVADFGIAVRESDLAARRVKNNRPIGNVAFISPEQYRGEESALTVASDVYSLGGVLFFLLTGSLPNGSTVEQIAANHHPETGRKSPPAPNGPGIDKDLAAICSRAMSLDPTQRHSSAAALADDLQAWRSHVPIAWLRPSLLKTAALAARRRPFAAAALFVAFLSILGGVGAVVYWSSVAAYQEGQATAARQHINDAKHELGDFIARLKRLGANRIEQDMIPITIALESLFGEAVLGTGEVREQLWAERVNTAKLIIADYTAQGRGDRIETLLWEGILGLWLLNGDNIIDAEKVLVPSAEKWTRLNLESDPLAAQVRRMAASATVQRLATDAKTRPLGRAELDLLAAFEAPLEEGTRPGPNGGIPTRIHTLRALAVLYEPGLLNQPEKLKKARRDLQRHLSALR